MSKNLIIKGNPEEVKAIIDRLIARYGNIKIEDVVNKYEKETLILQ